MKPIKYTYSVLRYCHDPSAGEQLNVGIVLYAAAAGRVLIRYDSNYGRLSQAFAGFNTATYRGLLSSLNFGIQRLASTLGGLLNEDDRSRFADAKAIVRKFWPDQGLSYQASDARGGIAMDVEAEADSLFDRFVAAQFTPKDAASRRSDDDLWRDFQLTLSKVGMTGRFTKTELGGRLFDYVFKNGKTHVVEPVSLDYLGQDGVFSNVDRTRGKALDLRSETDDVQLYVLVGAPKRKEISPEHIQRAITQLQELKDLVPALVYGEQDEEELARILLAAQKQSTG